MQEKRRSFAKKLALLTGVGVASVGLAAKGRSGSKMNVQDSNGVVIGSSNKKEILYTKNTMEWAEYYRTAD